MKNEETFDPTLSLQLDKATVALEEAEAAGDAVRVEYAKAWKARLETEIFGGTHENHKAY